MKFSNGSDETTAGDYFADAGDPRVEKDKSARVEDEATTRASA